MIRSADLRGHPEVISSSLPACLHCVRQLPSLRLLGVTGKRLKLTALGKPVFLVLLLASASPSLSFLICKIGVLLVPQEDVMGAE